MSRTSKTYKFTSNRKAHNTDSDHESGRTTHESKKGYETWKPDGNTSTRPEHDSDRLKTGQHSDHDHDGGFAPAGTSSSHKTSGPSTTTEKGYQFGMAADGTVTAVYEVKNGRVKHERMDRNESWSSNGQEVTKVETGFGKIETSVFTDADQNGTYQKTFDLEVITGQNPRSLETFKFLLSGTSAATGGAVLETDSITGMLELGRRGWKSEFMASNESLAVVQVGTDHLIIKTETRRDGSLDFSIFRDDDNDGLWTEIAEGHTLDAYVTPDGTVDLVGMAHAGLLEAASLVVG